MGVDYRVLNGYTYLSPVAITDGPTIEARVPHFIERAGYYFQNWNQLYDQWKDKIKKVIEQLEEIQFKPLPEMVNLDWVTSGRGIGSNFDMQAEYNRLIELGYQGWQYHFEFLN
jgi:pyruvate,water dikinase